MSGPEFRNGGGAHGGEDEDQPRIPSQREQSSAPDDLPFGVEPPGRACHPDQFGPPHADESPRPEDAGPTPPSDEPGGPVGSIRSPRPGPPAALPSASSSVSDRLPHYDHGTLKSLLGAWALSACSRDEALAVEVHLTDCASCADEALRLRNAVGLLHQEESLDLDPLLRARVLEGCLGRRPARIPVPEWAGPYDAETARLDALLRDLGDGYWKAPVSLRWFDGAPVTRQFTLGQVIAHLTAVDSLVARALGLPLGNTGQPGEDHAHHEAHPDHPDRSDHPDGFDLPGQPGHPNPHSPQHRRIQPGHDRGARIRFRRARPEAELPIDPWERTAAHWSANRLLPGATLRSLWREQSHHLVRTVSFAGHGVAGLDVDYGGFSLPLREAFLDRAFECWIHATDIADAVDYPYDPPAPGHLHGMIDLAARLLPTALAERRRAGLTTSSTRLGTVGEPGRSLRLEIEGDGGGNWYLPLDSPGAAASEKEMVAHVAMDSLEFCQLAAGHVEPERTAAGQVGDRAVIRDVLFATASLSRL